MNRGEVQTLHRDYGQSPLLAKYEEYSAVLAGERGDRRDHAIRVSDAYSIEGRKMILSALGIPTDDLARPISITQFPPEIINYVNLRARDLQRTSFVEADFTPGFSEGALTGARGGTAVGYGLTDHWSTKASFRLFTLLRQDDGTATNVTLSISDHPSIETIQSYPQAFAINPPGSGTVGEDNAFILVRRLGIETIPGQSVSGFYVTSLYEGATVPNGAGVETVPFFCTVRYLNKHLYANTSLPRLLISAREVPAYNQTFWVRGGFFEDKASYNSETLATLTAQGIDFDYAYPIVRMGMGIDPSMDANRVFDVYSYFLTAF